MGGKQSFQREKKTATQESNIHENHFFFLNEGEIKTFPSKQN